VRFLDDVSNTCQTERFEVDDEYARVYKPETFAGRFIPPGLHWAINWNEARSRYRIESCPSTPTTVCIALILRPGSPDYDRLEPERHELVLDRRTLLPRTWRKVRGDLDSLKTYSCFELDPAPRDLKVLSAAYRLVPQAPARIAFNFTINDNFSDGLGSAIEQADQVRSVLQLKVAWCVLRLFHMF
jgi:hypothetical protein